MSLLPTGIVTLLMADVEGAAQLWESRPDDMAAANAALNSTVSEAVDAHGGVRPPQQGADDGFAAAFECPRDAVACALDLQRAQLTPIRLRIGLHTGEVRLRDGATYVGPTINRAARLRDVAHGGQTLLSGATEPLVADSLPADAWLTDLGSHALAGLPRPERVVQLCHPDLPIDFAPLKSLPAQLPRTIRRQLTRFVGRAASMCEVRRLLAENRLLTLTGAGGVGKTRLAIQVATTLSDDFADGVWYVDLAPLTASDVVSVEVARALGLKDQTASSTMDTVLRFASGRQLLMVLDNCEHLLDASACVAEALLSASSAAKVMTTSREPIGAPGEVIWRVPSLSLADEAIELFDDRARHVRPDFVADAQDLAVIGEICRRLDGMPLAIELAAARVRVLSLTEILDGLHDRFRLLTGGARTATPRQQTLRASVEWSHGLLTTSERTLFRRLAVFMGGFDRDAAQAVCAGGDVERIGVLDQLTLLVDKSLVVAENADGRTRYRLLETMRQYALQKLGESGEADQLRRRHRDHYTSTVIALDNSGAQVGDERLDWIEAEIDNLRAAFAWSRQCADPETALCLVSALQPYWLMRGLMVEGRSWFHVILSNEKGGDLGLAPAVHARALADKAVLDSGWVTADSLPQAEHALKIARDLDDPVLVGHVLTACAATSAVHGHAARPYFTEAISLARSLGDRWRLSQLLGWQAYSAFVAGDPVAARTAGEEGYDLALAIGNDFVMRQCRLWGVGVSQMVEGALPAAEAELRELTADAEAAADAVNVFVGRINLAFLQAYRGRPDAARDEAVAAIDTGVRSGGGFYIGLGHMAMIAAELAAGDVAAAEAAAAAARRHIPAQPAYPAAMLWRFAALALAVGDLEAARTWADQDVRATLGGWHRALALTTRARVACAQDGVEQAERDARDALTCAADVGAVLVIPDILEILAGLAVKSDSHQVAVRLFAAAQGIRSGLGVVRFKVYDADHEAGVRDARNALGSDEFDRVWSQAADVSVNEAVAYARRGRGERKRPTTGWDSLTPTERDVVGLVSEGLATKEIAARLFVSPRTVQTHLTHVYAKLGLSSRVQLAQEAARHT
ncbi:LuxR family transcriptional regulator [Mycolicibacterium arenosum]|uniref:LuxR family transcriptional regulator n=1 Tax=Mycolicibacterium arenosum TaxID=2952157 RepID=A0ABT1LZ24_9MYCO|nr:LuxR family transcriptional regulator [Mycolicibacterium sp. CAU 1645]MCP9271575.1 LuxR family transcriptional regulator [Mycolicibacterium sp. CAU 1645]